MIMMSLGQIEAALDAFAPGADPQASASRLVALGEAILEHWIRVRDAVPTMDTREGFRLLALHRQGAQGVPSFNACRETCREIAYHYNLLVARPDGADSPHLQRMMAMLVKHLLLFVSGKLAVEGLGEFCCASRPLRTAANS